MEIDQNAMDVTSCNGISNGNQSDVSTYKNKKSFANFIKFNIQSRQGDNIILFLISLIKYYRMIGLEGGIMCKRY